MRRPGFAECSFATIAAAESNGRMRFKGARAVRRAVIGTTAVKVSMIRENEPIFARFIALKGFVWLVMLKKVCSSWSFVSSTCRL